MKVDPNFDLRLRSEAAKGDAFASNSSATTLRLRAGFTAQVFGSISAEIEGEGVAGLSGSYATDVVSNRPMILDPEAVEVNRAVLKWRGQNGTLVHVGRQRLSYGDERFVGSVDFRQNQQTYDAIRFRTRMRPSLELDYAYAGRVHTPLGDRGDAEDLKGDIHQVQLTRSFGDLGTVVGHVLALDIDNRPDLSSLTIGARYRNSLTLSKVQGINIGYALEAARQTEHGTTDTDFKLDYLRGEAQYEHPLMTLTGGVELLEGNGARGFSTPLATMAKFQGRADVFVITPQDGLVDVYLRGTASLFSRSAHPLAVSLTYHDFSTDQGDVGLGEEIDLVANWHLTDEVDLEAAIADFDSTGAGPGDLRRAWVSLRYRLN